MKTLIAALSIAPSVGFASVTLVFSDFSNSLSNLANFNGDTGAASQNGLAWGILIDTGGDNFSAPLVASVGLKVEDGANFGNGYFFYYGDTTVTSIGGDSGVGAAGTSAFDPYPNGSVSAGQSYAVMWFDSGLNETSPLSSGDHYGLVTNANFTLPADGSGTHSLASNFAGADPLRTANMTLIPEPSTALLAFLGMLGILRRRR